MDIETLIASTAVQPRPYQQRIVAKAVDLFADKGLRSILIDSPTGSGKTVMGLLIARALQERLGIRAGAHILEPAMGIGHFFGLMPASPSFPCNDSPPDFTITLTGCK